MNVKFELFLVLNNLDFFQEIHVHHIELDQQNELLKMMELIDVLKMMMMILNLKKNLILIEYIMVNLKNLHLIYLQVYNHLLLENDFLHQLMLIFQPK